MTTPTPSSFKSPDPSRSEPLTQSPKKGFSYGFTAAKAVPKVNDSRKLGSKTERVQFLWGNQKLSDKFEVAGSTKVYKTAAEAGKKSLFDRIYKWKTGHDRQVIVKVGESAFIKVNYNSLKERFFTERPDIQIANQSPEQLGNLVQKRGTELGTLQDVDSTLDEAQRFLGQVAQGRQGLYSPAEFSREDMIKEYENHFEVLKRAKAELNELDSQSVDKTKFQRELPAAEREMGFGLLKLYFDSFEGAKKQVDRMNADGVQDYQKEDFDRYMKRLNELPGKIKALQDYIKSLPKQQLGSEVTF